MFSENLQKKAGEADDLRKRVSDLEKMLREERQNLQNLEDLNRKLTGQANDAKQLRGQLENLQLNYNQCLRDARGKQAEMQNLAKDAGDAQNLRDQMIKLTQKLGDSQQ